MWPQYKFRYIWRKLWSTVYEHFEQLYADTLPAHMKGSQMYSMYHMAKVAYFSHTTAQANRNMLSDILCIALCAIVIKTVQI